MLVWRRWVFPLLLVAVFALIAVSLTRLAFFPDQHTVAIEPAAAVTDPVVAVERGDVVNTLSLTGSVARDEPTALKSDVDGTVTAVHVADGTDVTAGQALFTVKRGEDSRTQDIVAPEAGSISETAIVKGQSVSTGLTLATLTPARYHLLATVEPVQLYRLLDAPTDAQVTITGGPAPFTCTGLSTQVAEDGTTSIRCAVPTDQTVFAGLPATLDVTVGTVSDALIVPTTAVKGGAGSGVVWVDDGSGSDPVERTVTLGVNDGTDVEVVDGLSEGEMIREFVPGVAAPTDAVCYDDGMGGQYCDVSGTSW